MADLNLRRRVDRIIEMGHDPEEQHAAEDELMREWINLYVPEDDLQEFERLWAAQFPRWCA